MNKRLFILTFIALALSASAATATKLNNRKGLGYAQSIGGPDGLAFSYGANALIIEAIFGLQRETYDDSLKIDPVITLDFALGAHYQALRASHGAFTVGGRFNIMNGKPAADDITQFGFDIPMRVYYFANKNISIHTELGISILMGPDKGVLSGDVTAKGVKINGFNGNTGRFGNLGMTFWW
ncbi:hypothetical protein KKF91_07030 [Myxococcota bacterium]|nr:hypothetical protein [Myxococcota bacterium]MBU1896627.1 hypothetical protein [Myxococcota bacterium]